MPCRVEFKTTRPDTPWYVTFDGGREGTLSARAVCKAARPVPRRANGYWPRSARVRPAPSPTPGTIVSAVRALNSNTVKPGAPSRRAW